MQIDTIHYSRKTSDGNYGNAELGMHAQLEERDNPYIAAQELQGIVIEAMQTLSANARTADERAAEEYELVQRLAQKQRELDRMEKQWVLAKAFLEQHGVDTSRYTNVPF